jgi:hypothetical protein
MEAMDSFRGQFDDTKQSVLAAKQYNVIEHIIRHRVRLGTVINFYEFMFYIGICNCYFILLYIIFYIITIL